MNPNRFTDGSELRVAGPSWKRTPTDDVLVADGHFLHNRHDGVESLVILWPIQLDPQRLAVRRKRTAVGAMGSFSITLRLSASPMFRSFHLISGMAKGGSG